MKNVVLASVLSAVAGALVVPRLAGPVHYQLTRAHALYGVIPAGSGSPSTVTVSMGTLPVDFILQDILVFSSVVNYYGLIVKVNSTPVMNAASMEGSPTLVAGSTHLQGGVFIPAGSVIEVEAVSYQSGTGSVTLSGYVQ
jgi:hypothetical protein